MSSREENQQHINGVQESPWLNVTNDVLALILKRLNTRLSLCRFRSICKSWRLFASPLHSHLFFPLFLPPINPNSRKFSLSPTILYVISPENDRFTPGNKRVWLAKVAEIEGQKWDVFNPLTNHKLYFGDFGNFSSRVCKKWINLMGFRNYEVGRSYRLQMIGNSSEDRTFDFDDFNSSISLRKVAVNLSYDGKFSVLVLYNSGEIAIWNAGDDYWKTIEIGDKKDGQFDDVICYNGMFFAVDRKGRLVVINDSTFEVEEVVSAMEDCCGMLLYIYLIELDYKLYMVNKIVNPRPVNYYDEEEEEWVVDKTCVGKPLGFNVYVLNWVEKSWEKVSSLGNKVLFVSRDASFSVSAEDLGLSKGNCVYFEGLTGYDDEADMRFGLNAGVYSLEDGVISMFDLLPTCCTEIFWPDSRWFLGNDGYSEYEMQDGLG